MIIVYTKDNCPACNTLKATYAQNGVVFSEVNIGKDISREEFMATFPSVRTVPHVVEVKDGL